MAMPQEKGWAKIISAVKNDLGLFALVVLVLGAFFGGLVLRSGFQQLTLMIIAFVSVLGLVILIVGIDRLYQSRRSLLQQMAQNDNFARGLGEDINAVFGGAITNLELESEREEPYRLFVTAVTASKYVHSSAERRFVTVLIETVVHRAKQQGLDVTEERPTAKPTPQR